MDEGIKLQIDSDGVAWLIIDTPGKLNILSTPVMARLSKLVEEIAGAQNRSIKALSEEDVAALLSGQGAGYAKAAELNGYPGPAHTLELHQQLALSPEQVAASQSLMAAHKVRARELGALLVAAERRLDALFTSRLATPQAVQQAAAEVGALQARLRAEHLNTHLAQAALLDAGQVRRYVELRGYAEGSSTAPAPTQRPHRPHH